MKMTEELGSLRLQVRDKDNEIQIMDHHLRDQALRIQDLENEIKHMRYQASQMIAPSIESSSLEPTLEERCIIPGFDILAVRYITILTLVRGNINRKS